MCKLPLDAPGYCSYHPPRPPQPPCSISFAAFLWGINEEHVGCGCFKEQPWLGMPIKPYFIFFFFPEGGGVALTGRATLGEIMRSAGRSLSGNIRHSAGRKQIGIQVYSRWTEEKGNLTKKKKNNSVSNASIRQWQLAAKRVLS